MDTTTRVIQQKKINTDQSTGLDRYAQVICLNIDGANHGLITVKGRNVLVSPTGKTVVIESYWEFTRTDRPEVYGDVKVIDSPEVLWNEGEDMGNGAIATGTEIKEAEVSHLESQVVKAANPKYTLLEQSPIGLGIKQMLELDLTGAIVNEVWVETNLKQA